MGRWQWDPHKWGAISVSGHGGPAAVLSFWLEVVMFALFKYQAVVFVFQQIHEQKSEPAWSGEKKDSPISRLTLSGRPGTETVPWHQLPHNLKGCLLFSIPASMTHWTARTCQKYMFNKITDFCPLKRNWIGFVVWWLNHITCFL